jgi:hypothetical protein
VQIRSAPVPLMGGVRCSSAPGLEPEESRANIEPQKRRQKSGKKSNLERSNMETSSINLLDEFRITSFKIKTIFLVSYSLGYCVEYKTFQDIHSAVEFMENIKENTDKIRMKVEVVSTINVEV